VRRVAGGAYGLKLIGLNSAGTLMARPPASWPELRVEQGEFDGHRGPLFVGPDRAELPLLDGGKLLLERVERRARYLLPAPVGPDELAHPYLAPAASTFAAWDGRDTLHAGAYREAGRPAVALLAEKGGGKSTTLAELARRGVPVLTDDILVVEDGVAFAGPRCLDLRRGSAYRPPQSARVARDGDRFRLDLPPIAPEVALGGIVILSWGERPDLVPVRGAARAARIARQRWDPTGARPEALLSLAALPTWELRRPRRLDALPAAIALLRELAASL
jgi:hypothetical protein